MLQEEEYNSLYELETRMQLMRAAAQVAGLIVLAASLAALVLVIS